MWPINRIGHKIVIWGTPESTDVSPDIYFATMVCIDLAGKKFDFPLCSILSSLCSNLFCGTESEV